MTSPSAGPSSDRGIVSLKSPYPFADTVRRLLSAFADHGIKVFATIDQMAEAMAVGLTMPLTTLIIFGSPRAGTPLMLAQPLSGIDLPLKALVSESTPGQVMVSFNAATYIIERHSLEILLACAIAVLIWIDHRALRSENAARVGRMPARAIRRMTSFGGTAIAFRPAGWYGCGKCQQNLVHGAWADGSSWSAVRT